jgi:mitogen-activated protein kinase organizer 1
MGELRTDFFDRLSFSSPRAFTSDINYTEPVTSLSLAADASTILVSLLPSTLRLMDRSNGELLNTFKDPSFINESYRIHSSMSYDEENVMAGDEKGRLWCWAVLDGSVVAKEEDAHRKSVLWVETRPGDKRGCASAGADGIVKIWARG